MKLELFFYFLHSYYISFAPLQLLFINPTTPQHPNLCLKVSCCFKDTGCNKYWVASSKGFKSQREKVWLFHVAFSKCTEKGKGVREHARVLMVTE